MNAKKKGNRGENLFANWLQAQGINAHRNSSSGANTWKSDVHNGLGYNIEVKTVKRINLQEAWRQTMHDSSLAHTTPLLAIHFDGMAANDWLIVIGCEEWVRLLKGEFTDSQPHVTNQEDREKLYALQNLKTAISKVMKYYQN